MVKKSNRDLFGPFVGECWGIGSGDGTAEIMAKARLPKHWICKNCGHEVIAQGKPSFNWSDGHVCKFIEKKEG